jgi:hypothetical protein
VALFCVLQRATLARIVGMCNPPRKQPMSIHSVVPLTAALTLCLAVGDAPAGELYLNAGLPGVMLGFAQPLNDSFGLRADYATIGERSDRRTESGIAYDAKLKLNRAALFADWFPFSGSFRFTGGITSNQYRLDLAASGAGGSLNIGNTTYTTTAADQLKVQVRFPSSTPYFGFGWGHQSNTGLRFSMDVGAMFGKATVGYSLSGPLAQNVTQADIDTELAELRKGVGKVRAVPQLSLGLGYSF